MPPVLLNPPTNTLSNVLDTGFLPSWGVLAANDLEENGKLKFPESIRSYNGMGTDPQVQGLKNGSTWPIYRMRWYLDPGDAREDGVDRLSRDLSLPIGDDDLPIRRTRNRFKFLAHLEEALDAVFEGFKVFEQKLGFLPEDEWLHYLKLQMIPSLSIAEIKQEDDGGIKWIKQHGFEAPELSINRLVWYAFQKRGANWLGKSLLRGCYGPWLLKDRAVRVGVMNLQRAGVGTPVIEAHPGATEAELIVLNRLAERFKAGERSGGAVPAGARLRLVGVEGSQPDAVGFIKLMNEEMARAFLQMFMMAGQTGTGTRATAETHLDWHKLTLEYIASWFADIFNEHVIEDDWEWNYDEDEVPLLRWEWENANEEGAEAAEDPQADLRRRVEEGTLEVDEEVAAALGAIPGRLASSARRSAGRRARGGRATRAAGASPTATPPLPLPSRSLRRQPYDHEIAAAVDYNEQDTLYNTILDLLVMEVRAAQQRQVAALTDEIIDLGGDLAKLGALAAVAEHGDLIAQHLKRATALSVAAAVGEALRQGATVPPGVSEVDADSIMEARAQAVDEIITKDTSTAVAREAVRRTADGVEPVEVANQVRQSFASRTDAYIRDLLGGAVQHAINAGREIVFRRAKPEHIYASELLDGSTCVNCVAKDGTQYMNMDDAVKDYPSGGYRECLGRERCRGFLVAVYAEAEAAPGV